MSLRWRLPISRDPASLASEARDLIGLLICMSPDEMNLGFAEKQVRDLCGDVVATLDGSTRPDLAAVLERLEARVPRRATREDLRARCELVVALFGSDTELTGKDREIV